MVFLISHGIWKSLIITEGKMDEHRLENYKLEKHINGWKNVPHRVDYIMQPLIHSLSVVTCHGTLISQLTTLYDQNDKYIDDTHIISTEVNLQKEICLNKLIWILKDFDNYMTVLTYTHTHKYFY